MHIIVSLMSFTSDTATSKVLSNLLFDPLLLNYSGEVNVYLEEQLQVHKDNNVKQELKRALDAFESYIDGLKSTGEIPELHPSQENREVYRRHFFRHMSEAMKNAEKQSALLSILPKSILLYGRKSIDYVYSSDGETRRVEMPLTSFGTEVEIPRLENIDPFELDYMIRIFRVEQRKENETDS